MTSTEERLTNLEIYLANQDKMLEELNAEVLHQSKLIETLSRQIKMIKESITDGIVKPQSEETRPPHY